MSAPEAGESLLLEIFYNGAPAFSVPEYAEIELRLTNQTLKTLTCAVLLGIENVRADLKLRSGATWSIPFKVDDLVGDLKFRAISPQSETSAVLQVVPQKLSLEEVLYIKTERLPTLLSRLDAPNGLQLRYTDPEDQPQIFDFFSADYTAEKLRRFSRAFLDEGLAEAILNHLDYLTPERRASDWNSIRGPVNWSATVQNWLNRPAETGLRHEWNEAPRNFATLPNLLFVRFQLELMRELEQLVRFVELGGPASSRLKKALPDLKELSGRHAALLTSSLLPPGEIALSWDRHDPATLEILARECIRAAEFNPAYGRLYDLWQEFSSRYISLPEAESDLIRNGLQPMSKIYELWTTFEVATALGLKFQAGKSFEGTLVMKAESAVFVHPDRNLKLYYNRGLRGGWYSANRPGLPRPDLRLEKDGQQIFLDVKYRVGREERARPDDMYKMLAYMHDFGVKYGGIIFPGQSSGARAFLIESPHGQKLVELALRPSEPGSQAQFEEELAQVLSKNLGD